MIKIYSGDKIINLISTQKLFRPEKNSIMASVSGADELKLSYDELIAQPNLEQIFFFNESQDNLLSWFSSMFRLIKAAGGVVRNTENQILFIFRNGKWDLPKGKVEKGESLDEAAVREVEEECGLSRVKIVKKCCTTYHVYPLNDEMILKPTYWYHMTCPEGSDPKPQKEEGITEVAWIAGDQLHKVKGNTFSSIVEVLDAC
jgi:ADP-ribose pyrophosphatase YjhB (NUDIX family)